MKSAPDSALRPLFTPEMITELRDNEVFVFGSNLAGMHAGGAARFAYNKFGAIWGQGEGLQGQSYAIPTMQGGVETIAPYVDTFIAFAQAHPELHFLVTPIGCGIAGFCEQEIAPLFRAALNQTNHLTTGKLLPYTHSNDNPAVTEMIPRSEFINLTPFLSM